MSALDDVLKQSIDDYWASIFPEKVSAAFIELADLRSALAAEQQRAETAERERDEARAQLAQADALAMSATLTPRRCVTCARDAAREMREAVVKHCKDLANRTDICREAIDTKRNRMVRGEHIIYENLAAYFNSLPLPAECADCNPLKPMTKDEATR